MEHKKKLARIITIEENEVLIAIDSIMSVERDDSRGVITMKNGTIYTAKLLNSLLEQIEEDVKGVDELEKKFGVSVEEQPQFLNLVSSRSNILINANAIVKIEPLSETSSKITLMGEDNAVRVKSSISAIVETLANVAAVDAVDMGEL